MATVHWCARDLAGPPLGNHHFLLVVLGVGETLAPHAPEVQSGKSFVTLAGFVKDKRLQFGANDKSDVTAVREVLDPNRVCWWWPDSDLESHEVSPPGGNGLGFAQKLALLCGKYKTNEAATNRSYSLIDENCSCWVNTILKVAGVAAATRVRLGEFNGIDWGEEDTIDEALFA